jgi:hypothetical protein
MATERVKIDIKTMRRAAALAAARDPEGTDFSDTEQRYLLIRQRGPAATWLVKSRGRTRVLGSAIEGRSGKSDFLALKAARDKAAQVYASIAAGDPDAPPRPAPAPKPQVWTWSDLDREYQAVIAQPRWINRRRKAPAGGTMDDVRLAFAKAPLVALHPTPLPGLDKHAVSGAIEKIKGRRQREKCVAYVKAALTWAQDKRESVSGLAGVTPWWVTLHASDPDAEEMDALEARRAALLQAKEDFKLSHLAELLVRHEDYCAGRTANDKISPGIRFGIWWVAFTAGRRGATVRFLRDDLLEQDPFGEAGWGRAAWSIEAMKGKASFWLPLPPVVLGIATSCMKDWRALVNRSHGHRHGDSRWVFASSRRIGRKADNRDVSVYPTSLNRHLLRMKADGKLDGLPPYWPHLTRSVVGNYLENRQDVTPAASSLMLGHALPNGAEEAAPTTKKFYLTSQRMAEKAVAMQVWSDALMEAYRKAGGTPPGPAEN